MPLVAATFYLRHLLDCAERDNVTGVITAGTIERAAIALDYFISQAISFVASTEETLEAHLAKILNSALANGAIAPNAVRKLFSGKKRPDLALAKKYLHQLTQMGYGKIDDKGVFHITEQENSRRDKRDKDVISYHVKESLSERGFEEKGDKRDNNQSFFYNSGEKLGGDNGGLDLSPSITLSRQDAENGSVSAGDSRDNLSPQLSPYHPTDSQGDSRDNGGLDLSPPITLSRQDAENGSVSAGDSRDNLSPQLSPYHPTDSQGDSRDNGGLDLSPQLRVGMQVRHADVYHARYADIGMIEQVETRFVASVAASI